jgi:hypothetical protein
MTTSIRKSTFFWIGWMIEYPTKLQSKPNFKTPKNVDIQQRSMSKSSNVGCSIYVQCQKSKKFDFCWIIRLDFSVRSNPKIQKKSKNKISLDF